LSSNPPFDEFERVCWTNKRWVENEPCACLDSFINEVSLLRIEADEDRQSTECCIHNTALCAWMFDASALLVGEHDIATCKLVNLLRRVSPGLKRCVPPAQM
jgi:hypothetical protein